MAAGRIIKRQHIEPPREDACVVNGQRIGIRRVLYALPGGEWRIDASLLLWKTAEKSGWNEGFERLGGTLLGYEDRVGLYRGEQARNNEMQSWGFHNTGQLVARPWLHSLYEVYPFEDAQVMVDRSVVESDRPADLGQIGQLARKSSGNFQKAWNPARGGDFRNFRDIAFGD